MRGQMNPGSTGFDNRRSYWAYLFGRLKPGVTLERRAAARRVYRPILADVEAPLQEGMSERPRRFRPASSRRAGRARPELGATARRARRSCCSSASPGIVLLIACANIANLLLARGAGRAGDGGAPVARRRPPAARRAAPHRVVRARVLGGAAACSSRAGRSPASRAAPDDAAAVFNPHLDWPGAAVRRRGVARHRAAVRALPGAPQHAPRPDRRPSAPSAGQIAGGARAAARFRTSLVTAQIALSMALLVSAGLFIAACATSPRGPRAADRAGGHLRRLAGAQRLRPGALARCSTGWRRARRAARRDRRRRVARAAARRQQLGQRRVVEGFARPRHRRGARLNEVSAGYFRTLGVPLLAGASSPTPTARGRPKVAIVNEAFARKFGLGRDAGGQAHGATGDGPGRRSTSRSSASCATPSTAR
jgi:hypothetical protein